MPEALAPAKINLFLHVGPLRPDGYHPICSLMEKVTLYDRIFLKVSGRPGVRIEGSGIPPGENTVAKAARLLGAATGKKIGADFRLDKQIPVAAGLAGGSSDAAAALKMLASELAAGMSPARLAEVARRVGADVPFFLEPGPQLAEGAGERLAPAGITADYAAVIVAPPAELSTADVYRLYDRMCRPGIRAFAESCRRDRAALRAAADLGSLARLLHNDLEPPAMHLYPGIAAIKRELVGLGAAGALMSGSGPSVFGLFASKKQAAEAAASLLRDHPRVWTVQPLPR
ncbi:MAG: 4-(cytidine 5'-diphospho)-2-C-methyl-D-erythritol kinase [Thermoleophilia bacterium]|nr:4-(cytidine 5'-diphospho)-2-C-methyl-D-erythritol kinase [Thermoleophilia bacterium]